MELTITEEELEQLIAKAVKETLFQLGLAVDGQSNIEEARKDFAHLRRWRLAVGAVGTNSLLTAVGVLVTGILAAVFMGISQLFHGGH